tara:strand:+ start:906 stop:3131 length:2226 start_codon:yes stop_codon:yes gene_type:complete
MLKNYLFTLIFSFFSFTIVNAQCDYSLVMTDSYGDGWNNNTIDVLVDGAVVLDDVTFGTGYSETLTFSVSDGQLITTIWNGGGSYGSETSYQILDAEDFEVGSGAQTSIDSAITVACPPPPSCLYSINMIDSYGDGWNNNTIDVLVDGAVVLDDVTFGTGYSASLTFEVSVGSIVTTIWNGGGSYGSETSYEILDASGTVVGSGAQSSIEEESIVGQCPSCPMPIITSWNMTLDGVSFDGTNQDDILSYTVEYSETTFTPGDGTANSYTFDTFPNTMTGLSTGTTYYFAMLATCSDASSSYIGSPDQWTTLNYGSTGDAPIVIETLPYTTSDDTIYYGDDYTNSATGCEGSGSYLGGDDVVYLYQATSDMSLNITFTPDGTWSGIYVYASPADIGSACWIYNSTNSAAVESMFELSVTAGNDYYFVISTWPSPQNVSYTFSVEELLCGAPTGLSGSASSDTAGILSWDGLDDGTTYLLEFGDNEPDDISTSGTYVNASTFDATDLSSYTTYTVWLAAVCPDGSLSAAVSTSFTTMLTPPDCGDSLSYDYPNASSGGSTFDDNFDLNNDYSSDLLFSTLAGDQDGDGNTDEVTVTLSGSTENNYDWIFITDGAGNLLYGPVSGAQSGSYTSTDGTINVYLAADGSVQGGPVIFDVSCAGLSILDNEISDLRIFPNPVDGDIVTISTSISGDKFIKVFDINGREVLSTTIFNDNLNISSLEAGFYLTKVTIGGKTSVAKLIVN